MARIDIARERLSVIIEKWLEENANGGYVLMWDVDEQGVFRGIVADDVGNAGAVNAIEVEEDQYDTIGPQ